MTTLPFACRCGALTGRLTHVDPDVGTHALCHCKSCGRAMEIAGLAEEAVGGVDLYQTTPDRIEIETGAEHLVPREFSPDKGIYRWHAACCNTPMFNTMKTAALPFAGIVARNLADTAPLGPVIAEGFIPGENGKHHHRNAATLMWRFAKRTVRARLSGRHRTNPFFGADGKPVAPPQPLSRKAIGRHSASAPPPALCLSFPPSLTQTVGRGGGQPYRARCHLRVLVLGLDPSKRRSGVGDWDGCRQGLEMRAGERCSVSAPPRETETCGVPAPPRLPPWMPAAASMTIEGDG